MTARKYAPTCSFEGCERPHNSHGLCTAHGYQVRKGIPLRPVQERTGPVVKPAIERFQAKTRRQSDGCIVWTGAKTYGGYGNFAARMTRTPGARVMAHRWIYEYMGGHIPDGYDIDHLCKNRACVNVKHLEPVTRAENIRRAFAHRTHCSHGHEFTEANTIRKTGTNQRRCRTCARARDRARYPERNALRRERRADLRERAKADGPDKER